jgi:phosphate transport system substrate-binding protein
VFFAYARDRLPGRSGPADCCAGRVVAGLDADRQHADWEWAKPRGKCLEAGWRGGAKAKAKAIVIALANAISLILALALLPGFCGAAAAEGLVIGGTGSALGSMQLLAKEFNAVNPDTPATTVPSLGSGGAIRAVLDGAIGLAVSSRTIDARERALGAVEMEYARTPFIFAVSSRSRVTAITRRELADIYSGRMANWGDGSAVRIILRPASDIDTEIVNGMSADIQRGATAARARAGVHVSTSDQDAASDLETIPGSIGPSTLALIVSENRALRALTLDGKEPTPALAAAGGYPYYKRLFLVTGARRTAAAERFIAFVRSPAGRKILVGNGQWIP